MLPRPAAHDTGPRAAGRPRRRRPWLVGELLIVLVLLKVYDYVRSLADARHGAALAHGRDVLAVERDLHLDVELGLNRWLTGHHGMAWASVEWYQRAHIGVTLTVLAWCYIAGPDLYRPARNALVLTNLAGMTVFFVLPVMPPRLLPGAGFADSVALAGFGTTHGGPVPADQYAAMPSLHLAWATWVVAVAVALLRRHRARWLAALYPVTTAFVVMATANHFLLDVLAGMAVTAAAVLATGLVWAGNGTVRAGGQMIRRRSRTANTQAPGSSGSQTVISRYPTTAPSAAADGTPAHTSPATSTTSSPPMPPGEGTRAETEETTR
nr:phosphatase PAP2 family protein [Actinomadura sp. RB99]